MLISLKQLVAYTIHRSTRSLMEISGSHLPILRLRRRRGRRRLGRGLAGADTVAAGVGMRGGGAVAGADAGDLEGDAHGRRILRA